jgi:hypothetical protein
MVHAHWLARATAITATLMLTATCRDPVAAHRDSVREPANDAVDVISDAIACAGRSDTTKVPITDLTAGCYLQFRGGLYVGGSNVMPATHEAAGRMMAADIMPRALNGTPSANGKYVLLSIGMSNTTDEFCSDSTQTRNCQPPSFISQAAADAAVNHSSLVIVDGAYPGRAADAWVSPTSPEYDRIRNTWLAPLGVSERQVQIVWVKEADLLPTVALTASNADAYQLLGKLAQIARTLKMRYPNLRQVFLSSRIYAGYAKVPINPEPYAYESAFAVKWAIQSQIVQMLGSASDVRTGPLRYDTGVAPWMAWGPYMWAAGPTPRSDGLTWLPRDFESDGTHPSISGRGKVGSMLLSFFKKSSVTSCWFLAGQKC